MMGEALVWERVMVANVTEADEGKAVVAANGERIGTAEGIEDGSVRVDLDTDVTHAVRTSMEWDDPDRDTFELQNAAIDEVTDDEIRLVDEFSDSVEK